MHARAGGDQVRRRGRRRRRRRRGQRRRRRSRSSSRKRQRKRRKRRGGATRGGMRTQLPPHPQSLFSSKPWSDRTVPTNGPPKDTTCPRPGWISALLSEWLRNAVQPPGSRTAPRESRCRSQWQSRVLRWWGWAARWRTCTGRVHTEGT